MEGVNYSDLIAEGKLAGVKSILHYTPPGAETIEEFDSRAMDFFCEICKYVASIILYGGSDQLLNMAHNIYQFPKLV